MGRLPKVFCCGQSHQSMLHTDQNVERRLHGMSCPIWCDVHRFGFEYEYGHQRRGVRVSSSAVCIVLQLLYVGDAGWFLGGKDVSPCGVRSIRTMEDGYKVLDWAAEDGLGWE